MCCVVIQMFNAGGSGSSSPKFNPKKRRKEDATTPLKKVLLMVDPNGVHVAEAKRYQKRMFSVEEAPRGSHSVLIRKRFVPEYSITGYQAANAAKNLRARFEGEYFKFFSPERICSSNITS